MIRLYFMNGRAFVWNADDWATIRQKHRIIGELIGTIASQPRQGVYPGLPMALMSEETALLIEEGIATLVEYTNFDAVPTNDEKSIIEKAEEKIYNDQLACMKEKRIEMISSRIDLIVAGKQKKHGDDGNLSEYSRDELLNREIAKLTPLSKENSLIQIPLEHPWPHKIDNKSVNSLIPDIVSDIGAVRYRVFKDLWKRGYFLTAGTKFGGDFLIYLGDPVKFHAAFIVKCLNSDTSELSLSEIVAYGRLGVSVNKLCIYAYISDDNLRYQTLQWHETLY